MNRKLDTALSLKGTTSNGPNGLNAAKNATEVSEQEADPTHAVS